MIGLVLSSQNSLQIIHQSRYSQEEFVGAFSPPQLWAYCFTWRREDLRHAPPLSRRRKVPWLVTFGTAFIAFCLYLVHYGVCR